MATALGSQRLGEAFDIPNFDILSRLTPDETASPGLQVNLEDLGLEVDPQKRLDIEYGDLTFLNLELPPLEDLHIDPPSSLDEELDLSYVDVDLETVDSIKEATQAAEDVWQINKDLPPLSSEPRLISWENSTKPHATQTNGPAYISEAGSAVFDAALSSAARRPKSLVNPGRPLQAKPLLRPLCQLGLGRASTLFRWDEKKQAFEQSLSNGRGSGYSLECSQSMIETMLSCGTSFKSLLVFVDRARSRSGGMPTATALAGVVDTILSAIEEHMLGAETVSQSLLHVQSTFEPVRTLLALAEELVGSIRGVSTDVGTMNRLAETLSKIDDGGSETNRVCRQTLRRITWHWLRKIEEWTGLATFSGLNMHPVQVEQLRDAGDDCVVENLDLPEFITEDEEHLIHKTRRCLYYLQDHHENHSVVNSSLSTATGLMLDLQLRWEDVERLQKKADNYQQDLTDALAQASYSARQVKSLNTVLPREVEHVPLSEDLELDFDLLDLEPQSTAASSGKAQMRALTLPDELLTVVQDFLNASKGHDEVWSLEDNEVLRQVTPPMSLVPSLSIHPILKAQHDILSYTAIHSILHNHALLSHLHLHHSFSLLGSGLFVARLRDVLFSTETESTERRSNVLRTGGSSSQGSMGLHLGAGDRQQWPPASSEVRLALMNLIPDAWRDEATTPSRNQSSSMPATPRHHATFVAPVSASRSQTSDPASSLSFTIRTSLPESSITKILNPHSIHALDFLALTCTPPPALLPLFPPRVLAHYDRIFAHQLRLLRVSASLANAHQHTRSLVRRQPSHLISDSPTRLALGLHHSMQTFHSILLTHTRHAAIDAPWRAFLGHIHAAAWACASPIPPASRQETKPQSSLDALAALHESTLRRILGGLMLRKKQVRLMEALEGVWEVVLGVEVALGSVVGSRGGFLEEKEKEVEPELRRLLSEFGERTAEFVRRCKESLAAGGEEEVKGDDAEVLGVIGDLVAVLRWNEPEMMRVGVRELKVERRLMNAA